MGGLRFRRLLHPKLVAVVAGWALWIGMSPERVLAMPSESSTITQTVSASRQAQIDRIVTVLSRPQAQVHLRAAGIRLADLKTRLSELDDAQLARVAQRADRVKAAGQWGIVIGLLVVVILIIVIVMLLDDKEIKVVDDDD